MKNLTLSAAKIAEIVGGEIKGDPARTISRVEGIRHAGKDDLSFVSNKRYQHQLEASPAGIVLVCRDLADADASARTLVVCDNVDVAFGKIVALFAEEPPKYPATVHPSAVVDPSAKLGAGVSVGPNAVIEAGAEIGDRTVIGACAYIGHQVKIGSDTFIAPNVTIMYRCVVGNKVILNPGVVIGGDGFGFTPTPQGLVKIPQTGFVQIDDDVEIGANTTVDRARFGCTRIKSNAKIDNLVMIAHNVIVGESSILVGQSGIAGSAEIGRGVVLGGKAGVNGHIVLGDGVQIAGTSNVQKSLPAGAIALGTPAESQRDCMARLTLPRRFERLKKQVEELQAEVEALKKK
ncbi:MAG: UDP-3-O-(3-hydroxymyristoyl)glucosamine N-acyltransferase [Victivallaceae bacterium]|nr:UDP-3-O-(3-hydroxymyristoyl)glucosamine N-acyltransferase [Victivallaceae bacterium]